MKAQQMQAVYLIPTRNGGVYEYRQVNKPEAAGGQVLVQVIAAGINRGEILMVGGFNAKNPRLKPMAAGIEFAGEIVEVGEDATGWHVGERVMGRGMGSYAEFTLASCMTLMRIPDGLSFAEAAAIPNVFITAHDALVSNAQIQKDDTVLVTAASSGIGTAAIQLAKYYNARTIVASTRDANKAVALRNIGADVVIDTSKPGFPKLVEQHTDGEGVDIIIDSVGGPMFADNLNMLAVKGRIISVGRNAGEIGQIDLDEIANKRAQVIGTTFRTRTPQEAWRCFEVFVEDCMGGFTDGSLRPVLDRTFPFESLLLAHNYMLDDGQVGKIVLVRE
ncbi:MAG: zinc-binding dehydrogenase [bacterium]|nr:acryloyl-CoA reductase [Gammaproteobacteria bacterium]HIL98733.1 acryloyl-CoA reductase [Pseudomonadales bacterium]